MSTATASRPRPQARLLPARDAVDYDYFRELLADPSLADAGVAVTLFRIPLLAVPVGGQRRGGYTSFGQLADAVQARALLSTVSGFPGLRIRWSPYRETCHTVEWGELGPPWWENDEVFGNFYGYSTNAIAAFVQNRSQTPSSEFSEPWPPTALSHLKGVQRLTADVRSDASCRQIAHAHQGGEQ
ncbi:DUF6302 family protein [Streptomyces formicae]|uniref:Uncharacterized protein n=1 Tax=Streptomyces formicae TaxID=1616117 RepID=A0ABY3WKJ4_9ACTN|nr:DUF6302 family protein [Streptomyces formicae]UNM13139.1 hypothetical protein J4032_18025 [Streptomyces formicae]